MRSWSIRFLLVTLVVACSVPLVTVLAWSTYRDYRASVQTAEAGLISLAEVTAGDLQRFLDDAEAILARVSQRAWLAALDPDNCSPIFAEARNLLPRFTNLNVRDTSGIIVCGTLDFPDSFERTSAAGSYWFDTVMRTGAFTIGKPEVGAITGTWLTMLAYPLHAADSSLAGVVTLSVDLERFQNVLAASTLPPGGVISLFDADGTIVARSSDPSEFVGTKLGDEESGETHSVIGTGVSRSIGIEGIDRVWGFTTLSGGEWRVYAGVPADRIYAPLRATAYRGALLSFAILLLVGALTFVIYRHIAQALEALVEGTQAVADGHRDHYLGDGPAEVVHVGEQFARMVHAREEAEKAYLQAQRMEAVGRLAGGIAHDFNNLLTSIGGHAELLLHEPKGGADPAEDLQPILDSVEQAAALTQQLLTFSRQQVVEPTLLDAVDVVEGTVRMLRGLIREDVEVAFQRSEESLLILMDKSQFEQIILNLVLNARDALPTGGRVALDLARRTVVEGHRDVRPGTYLLMNVVDDGEGVPEAIREQIFEPFFSTKPAGKGTGLGLATVYGIVSQNGGHISVHSAPAGGAAFSVHLPLAGTTSLPGALEPATPHPTSLV